MSQYPASSAPQAGVGRDQRAHSRRPVRLPARLTWKDQRGATHFAAVVTRDVSELGVFVESPLTVSLPLFRLVQIQLEREARDERVPAALRYGQILSAVYRVSPAEGSRPQGFALRLMVDPKRQPAASAPARATA